jgi:hypothetical protein
MFGLLVLCFDYSKVDIGEFNDWYDTEHIPERERTKGILNAQRWLDVTNRRISVAVYDLESVEALMYPEYLAISGKNLSPWSKRIIPACTQLLRFEGHQFSPGDGLALKTSPLLLMAGVNPAADQMSRAREQYREHAKSMAGVPGVQSIRIFGGTNRTVQFLELYELSSADVPKSDDWARADAAHGLGGLNVRAAFIRLCSRYKGEVAEPARVAAAVT